MMLWKGKPFAMVLDFTSSTPVPIQGILKSKQVALGLYLKVESGGGVANLFLRSWLTKFNTTCARILVTINIIGNNSFHLKCPMNVANDTVSHPVGSN